MSEKKIAFVLYPGLTMLDMIGPLQVISGLGDPYEAVVVAETTDPMPVSGGLMSFAAPYTFDDIPHPFGIIVPGGGMPTIRAMANQRIRQYLLDNAEPAEFIGSVCTGALILAAAGLLEGRNATTHWGYHPELEQLGATFQRKRWVEDGKFITAAGVSAGIDMALHLASRLVGEERAKMIQLGIEYDPSPPFGGLDYDGVLEQAIHPKDFSDDQKQAFKEALTDDPAVYERLMS
jgi:transcriptional regulator GlxA family with amidase domain